MYITLLKSELQDDSDNIVPLTGQLTKSVLHFDWLLHISWIRLSSSVDCHDSEAVQSTFSKANHLKFGLLAGVWSVVYLKTAAGEFNITFHLEIKLMQCKGHGTI